MFNARSIIIDAVTLGRAFAIAIPIVPNALAAPSILTEAITIVVGAVTHSGVATITISVVRARVEITLLNIVAGPIYITDIFDESRADAACRRWGT